MKAIAQNTIIAILFIWIGLILGISFLEAWLKFRAPNVTLPIGLGIGRLVFSASNSVQIVFAILVLSLAFWQQLKLHFGVALAIAIVLLHTFWLLPTLDNNAALIINNQPSKQTYEHFLFVGTEVIKCIALIVAGYNYLIRNNKIIIT